MTPGFYIFSFSLLFNTLIVASFNDIDTWKQWVSHNRIGFFSQVLNNILLNAWYGSDLKRQTWKIAIAFLQETS